MTNRGAGTWPPTLSLNARGMLIKWPRLHGLEKSFRAFNSSSSSPSSSARDIIGTFCIPLLSYFFFSPPPRFHLQPQKIRGARSIPGGEEKSAAERATQRKNKQISKHFYIKTSNVPRDETTRRSLTHWQPQTYDKKRGSEWRGWRQGGWEAGGRGPRNEREISLN